MTHREKLANLTVNQFVSIMTCEAFGYPSRETVDYITSINKREIVTKKSGRYSLKTGRQVGFIGAPEAGDSYIVLS